MVAFLAGSEGIIDYFCFCFAWLWVKSWPSPAFFIFLGQKISVPWVSGNLSEKYVNGTDLCVSLQTSEVTGIPFAFWLSYGSAIAGNFIRKLFQNNKWAPQKAIRERERERGHTWLILCLFKKKKKIYEKGLKSLKKACFVIIPFLYHFVIILSLTFLI